MLILRHTPDESWSDAAIRQARVAGVEHEVTEAIELGIGLGLGADALNCWEACYEWDCLEYEPDDVPSLATARQVRDGLAFFSREVPIGYERVEVGVSLPCAGCRDCCAGCGGLPYEYIPI